MTTKEIVKQHLEAAAKLDKKIGNSKRKARAFLIKAGVLDKTGKKLCNYRA